MKPIQLNIDSLQHRIGQQIILQNINLNLDGFQAVTVLGPNGAGKSSLMKAMAGHFFCQSGTVLLNGIDSLKSRQEYLKMVGYMPESPLIISELTVIEQLQLMANSKRITGHKQSIKHVVEICQLEHVLNKRTQHLSLGFKQRLNLAQAILNKPKLLIMDEPLNGLDPHLIIIFRNIINELKKQTLIIMSTHYLAEAQNISDRILIMQNGQLLDNIETDSSSHQHDIEKIYMQHTTPVGLDL